MNKDPSRIYVGCSLTQAPEEFRNSIEAFKDSLRDQGHEVFNFVGLQGGTEADVYNWDIQRCVRKCDVFVGVCDYPSIGLGWELAEAKNFGKPVLMLAHEQSQITRLALGAAVVEPNVHFTEYANADFSDAIPLINELALRESRKFRSRLRRTGRKLDRMAGFGATAA